MKRLLILLAAACTLGAQAARIDRPILHSEAMNRDIPVTIIAPDDQSKPHPVVYLLHGAYGNENSWLEIKPNLPDLADEKGIVFVSAYALNSWYFDSPTMADFRYETFMTADLIQYVDTHYPTIANRTGRAITGLSMGGHGALFLAMRHKDLYGAAGSMSGGVDIRPFPLNWNLPDVLGEMASNKQQWDDHTVVNQLSRIENGDLRLTIDCGEADFFLEVNKDLHQRLLGRGIDHDFTTRPGGHNNEYWGNSIDYHLVFFQKYFASAKPHD